MFKNKKKSEFERMHKNFHKKQKKLAKKMERRKRFTKRVLDCVNPFAQKKEPAKVKTKKQKQAKARKSAVRFKGVVKVKNGERLLAIFTACVGCTALTAAAMTLAMRAKQKAIATELEAKCEANAIEEYSVAPQTDYNKASIEELEKALLRVENELSVVEEALNNKKQ